MTQTESYRSFKSIPKWMLMTLLGLSFVFFGNSITNGFALDDDLVTSISEDVIHPNVEKGVWGIPEIFTSHYVQNAEQQYGYRPIATTSFAVEKSFYAPEDFEKRAHFSHFINVLLYGLNAVLVCVLIFKILPAEGAYLAFIIGLVFLVHPIHSEVVNNIKCRDELLVFFFGMISLLSFWKYVYQQQKQQKWVVLGLFMLTLSVLSKTNGILFVVLIPLVIYYFSNLASSGWVKIFGVLIGMGVVVIVVSKLLVADAHIRDTLYLENPLYVLNGFGHKIPMFFYSVAWYLKMLIFPYPLCYYYGFNQIPLADWSHPMVWVGVIFVCGGTTLAFLRVRKKEVWTFGFLFFMLAIGSLANLFRVAPGIVAERFAYLPSLGLLIVVVHYAIKWIPKSDKVLSKKIILGMSSLLLLLVSMYNWNRNEVWESKFSLYKNDIVHLQNSAKANSLLSQEYKNLADQNRSDKVKFAAYMDSTMMYIDYGLKVYPEYANLWNNKGYLTQVVDKNLDSAMFCYSNAILSYSKYDEAYYSLASVQMDKLGGMDEVVSGLSLVVEDTLGTHNLESVNYSELEELGVSSHLINQGIIVLVKQSAQQVVETKFHSQLITKIKAHVGAVLENSRSIEIIKFPFEEHTYQRLSNALKTVTRENASDVMQQYLVDVNNLFIYYVQSIFQKEYDVDQISEVSEIFSELEEQREDLVQEIIFNYSHAIEYGETKLHYYEKLAQFLNKENRAEEFIAINEKGIAKLKLKNKSQLYINLILLYRHQNEKDKALMKIEEGIDYLSIEMNEPSVSDEEKKKMKKIQNYFNELKEQITNE